MLRTFFCGGLACTLFITTNAQNKKPLDHTVYDQWESINERLISNDGKWVVFTIQPQEGDGRLMAKAADGSFTKEIARGYDATLTEDNRWLVFKIKPTYKETRDAKIKKTKLDELPKDSLAYLELGTDNLVKIARVKSYKTPEKAGGWLAYLKEKPLPEADKKKPAKNPALDSANRVIDSLKLILNKLPEKVINKYIYSSSTNTKDGWDAEDDAPGGGAAKTDEGTELVTLNLATGKSQSYQRVADYGFGKYGRSLWLKTTKAAKDSIIKPAVQLLTLASSQLKTVMNGFNDAKGFALDEAENQLAFAAERDSSTKALQKFYKLWYFKTGADSATMVAAKGSTGIESGWTICEFYKNQFSKSGKRLFFGVAPVLAPKDTSLPEFERVNVDVWNYKDDYLQPYQLKSLDRELKRGYLAIYDIASGKPLQIANKQIDMVQTDEDGDGPLFLGMDNRAYRVESQWSGRGKYDLYAINPTTGATQSIIKNFNGQAFLSPGSEYIGWYDSKSKLYFTWKNGATKNISAGIKTPLYDEENDVPDEPSAYGRMAWEKGDKFLYVYDRYDIWKLDATGAQAPVSITKGLGRQNKLRFRYKKLNAEEQFIEADQPLLLTVFNETDKTAGLQFYQANQPFTVEKGITYPLAINAMNIYKAKNAASVIYSTETSQQAADIKWASAADIRLFNSGAYASANSFYLPNPQQANYNWMTAELISWKAYNGKTTQGILYKPENFDPTKKYPLISYFYETLSDNFYSYTAPAPTPSRLNIPFFVSRGYCVLAPDIHYATGQPGQDAYDYIVSGVRSVAKKGFIDTTRMGLQGQSWGGYQTAQLITMTSLFKAAWAGAPVANMTSAYGGIRWESGLNRQMQYEKQQSRIGATLWDKPERYIKNSPLFALPKVKTPLVIMANDADGAVPWYQGIELFTAMRRLGKPVWMLNYNGEAHNLVERKNRKDIQIREQQYFDWLLQNGPEPKWLKEGVPAVEKGRTLGLAIN